MTKILQATNGIRTDEWGRGEAKTIEDLVREIKAGESVLRIEPDSYRGHEIRLVRVLRVVKMKITQTRTLKILREVEQILPDGRRRQRNELPSGKIRFNETPTDAMHREMEEKLTLEPSEYIWNHPTSPKIEERFSRSYPGLLSIYELYTFSVDLTPNVENGRFRNGFRHKEASGVEAVFAWV